MSYLVMECHRAYAVVLRSDGCFLKVANMHYEVGQLVSDVIVIEASAANDAKRVSYRARLLSLAACLCLVFLGSWQLVFLPYGIVRMQINPAVQMCVNRLGYVTELEGLNPDGEKLLEDTSSFGKKLNGMADELADKAMQMGYLQEGGSITVLVSGRNEKWADATERELQEELYSHLHEKVEILTDAPSKGTMQPRAKTPRIVIPVGPRADEAEREDESGRSDDDSMAIPAEVPHDADDSRPEPIHPDGSPDSVPVSHESDYDDNSANYEPEAPVPQGRSNYEHSAPTDGDSGYDASEPSGDSGYSASDSGGDSGYDASDSGGDSGYDASDSGGNSGYSASESGSDSGYGSDEGGESGYDG